MEATESWLWVCRSMAPLNPNSPRPTRLAATWFPDTPWPLDFLCHRHYFYLHRPLHPSSLYRHAVLLLISFMFVSIYSIVFNLSTSFNLLSLFILSTWSKLHSSYRIYTIRIIIFLSFIFSKFYSCLRPWIQTFTLSSAWETQQLGELGRLRLFETSLHSTLLSSKLREKFLLPSIWNFFSHKLLFKSFFLQVRELLYLKEQELSTNVPAACALT